MKILIILSMLSIISCSAQSPETSTKLIEVDRDKDGRVDYRIEDVYRGDNKIMRTLSKCDTNGSFVVSSRSYFVEGEMVSTESDEDGDGFLETLAIYNPRTDDLEMFLRQADGSVQPVNASTLGAFRKKKDTITSFWDSTLGKGEASERAGKIMSSVKQSIQAADKDKENAHKNGNH